MKYSIIRELFEAYTAEHVLNERALFYIYLKESQLGFAKGFYPVFNMDSVEYVQSSDKTAQSSDKTVQSSDKTNRQDVRDIKGKSEGSGAAGKSSMKISKMGVTSLQKSDPQQKEQGKSRPLQKDKNKNIESLQNHKRSTPTDEEAAFYMDDDDEEYLDDLADNIMKQNSMTPDEALTVVWFFIANPDNGKFTWVDSTKTVYIQKNER